MRRLIDPLHVVDLFVYVVVLNLAAQFVPGVIVESFAMSLLTAVLLKVVLEIVLAVKTWIVGRLRAADRVGARLVSIGLLALVLPGSKLVLLWLEDVVLGDAVSLGGFLPVTGLVIVLTLSRFGVRRLFVSRRVGSESTTSNL